MGTPALGWCLTVRLHISAPGLGLQNSVVLLPNVVSPAFCEAGLVRAQCCGLKMRWLPLRSSRLFGILKECDTPCSLLKLHFSVPCKSFCYWLDVWYPLIPKLLGRRVSVMKSSRQWLMHLNAPVTVSESKCV